MIMPPEGNVDSDPNDGLPDEQESDDDDCSQISDIFRARTESLDDQ